MNPVSNQKKKDWQHFSNKQTQKLFEILTGKVHFPLKPFTNQDLEPDLIIRIRVPEQQFLKRSLFHPVSAFVRVPSEQLEQAFNAGEKKIMDDMTQAKENEDNKEVKFRLNKSLIHLDKPQAKESKMMHVTKEEQIFELECIDQKINILDGYTLDLNTILYLLQEKCGFKVRAFLVNSMQTKKNAIMTKLGIGRIVDTFNIEIAKHHVRDIYLFLNLSIENMLKVAARFKIKKELNYSNIDMSLNDPSSSDGRPLRFHSQFVNNIQFLKNMKSMSRYFKTRQINTTNSQIIEEASLSLSEIQKFMSYWEEVCLIFQFFKNVLSNEVSNEEKIYLYEYNRGKLNEGCEKTLTLQKKIHQFYELMKEVNSKYGYQSLDQPDFYEEFIMPNKKSKGGFFHKLNSMLIYKAEKVTPYGDESLFNSMERTKICYILVKEMFKINYLNKLGCDIFMLNNDFEKQGKGGKDQKVAGGLSGSFLGDRWNIFALFTDIKLIRSYFGDVIAFQITIKNAIIFLLLIISIPTIMLYIFQLLYGEAVEIVSDFLEISLFVISFSIFTLYVQEQQKRFDAIYSDKKPSSVFLNEYRGPYTRNPITDEVNEYVQEKDLMVLLKNFVCLIVFVILAVCFGAFFYGCRNLLLSISDPLYKYQSKFISLSHIIAYCIYFLLGDLFKFQFYGYIVKFMIFIKNPPTDQVERQQRSYFTFYYLLVMECVPIFFFYILEPFLRTSCYANNCGEQYKLYIYARFLFNIGMAVLSFIQVLLLGWGKRALLALQSTFKDKQECHTFHQKLRKLLSKAIRQNKKSEYEQGLTRDILTLFAYCFYCTSFTISGVVALLYILTIYVVMRTSLMQQARRPINKSEPIVSFSSCCNVIYFCGIIFNIWIYTFLTDYPEKYYGFMINYAPAPLTYESIFMIKMILTAVFFILFSILGIIVRKIVQYMSPGTLIKRQKNKYENYRRTVGAPRTKEVKFRQFEPLKSIFRIFNPQIRPDDKLDRVLQQMNEQTYRKMSFNKQEKEYQQNKLQKSNLNEIKNREDEINISQTRLKAQKPI